MSNVTAVVGDVMVGWVHPGGVTNEFLVSLLQTLDHDRDTDWRIGGYVPRQCSANVSAGRNEIVEWFLGTSGDWLMMVDTDMVWPGDAVHRLLEYADPQRAPIVGGLCFAKDRVSGRIWPTLFEVEPVNGEDRFFRFHSWPDGMFRVDGTGAAFLLVHRGVLETIRDRKFSAAYPWFQETENAWGRVSEDLTFCLRARACGFPIHVNTRVRVGHIKTHVLTARDYVAQVTTAAPTEKGDGGD